MDKNAKIYIAGHKGLVGSALKRKLEDLGYTNLVLRTKEELNLLDQVKTAEFFKTEKPDYVFLAAAKVGGIMANRNFPADFIYNNLVIQNNIIHNCHDFGVKKMLFLGSSCIYPRKAPQPIKEEYLLTGELEPTNLAYAVAKIAGIITAQSFKKQHGTNIISVMPTNIYGPGDNFDLENSHVIPSFIRRFHDAKQRQLPEICLWSSGMAKREFLHTDDLADACIFLMDNYDSPEIINIGTGLDLSIKELAEMISGIVGYAGRIDWDTSKPDGAPRKLLDVGKIQALGWKHSIGLRDGIMETYGWYQKNLKD